MKKALAVSAPEGLSQREACYRSFEEIYSLGIAPGYVITESELAQVPVGSTLVIIDNDAEKRAEAKILEYRKAELAGNNQQRYDIHFGKPRMVKYAKVKFRWPGPGVAVIDV